MRKFIGQAYSYNTNVNLTGKGAKTFIYDVENHLTQVKDSIGTSLATFVLTMKVSALTSSGTIYYHYSGEKVIYETDANDNIVADYTWDSQGKSHHNDQIRCNLLLPSNGHGDVTSLTDATGTTVASYQYNAWGNVISVSVKWPPPC